MNFFNFSKNSIALSHGRTKICQQLTSRIFQNPEAMLPTLDSEID
jgi:hypothetical protein